MGITISEVVFDVCGGIKGDKQFKAVQMGGPSGGCIPAEPRRDADRLRADHQDRRHHGLGRHGRDGRDHLHGGRGPLLPRVHAERVVRQVHLLPHRHAAHAGDPGAHRAGQGQGGRHRAARGARGRSSRAPRLCGLGQTAPNPVLTTLRYFRDEYEAHIREKRCPAHQCPALVKFIVIPREVHGLHAVRAPMPRPAHQRREEGAARHRPGASAPSAASASRSATSDAIYKAVAAERTRWHHAAQSSRSSLQLATAELRLRGRTMAGEARIDGRGPRRAARPSSGGARTITSPRSATTRGSRRTARAACAWSRCEAPAGCCCPAPRRSTEGMDVWTESAPAMQARRKAALEMLLSNHYADCRGPCFLACPAGVDVQGYLALANARDVPRGARTSSARRTRCRSPAAASACGTARRAAAARTSTRPAAINFIKRYVADLRVRQPAAARAGPRDRQEGGGHRRRPRRPHLRLLPGHNGYAGHHLRQAAQAGRHAALRHPRVPPARGRARQGDRLSPGPRDRGEDRRAAGPGLHASTTSSARASRRSTSPWAPGSPRGWGSRTRRTRTFCRASTSSRGSSARARRGSAARWRSSGAATPPSMLPARRCAAARRR